MARYPDAVAWAKSGGGDGRFGHCLLNVRLAFGQNSGLYPDAFTAWKGAGGATGINTHTLLTPPKNVPVFWSGGAHGYGHVAISDGDGYIWTTDATRTTHGKFTRVKLTWVRANWGLRYLGWSETLNGERVHAHVDYTP